MVMEYIRDGDLRHYLKDNYNKLSFRDKLTQLITLANGLKSIHKEELIHQDLHVGNVLINNKIYSHITDMGLSRPVNEDNTGKIYGNLPYVAPEVLNSK